MLAFTVFAMLAVGAITIMNQGVASAQEALETTLVRQQIDGQAETLRFLQQAYAADQTATGSSATFKGILANSTTNSPTSFGASSCLTKIPDANNPFVVNPLTGAVINGNAKLKPMSADGAPAYAQLVYNTDQTFNTAYGIWVEAIQGETEANAPKFVDFHIRACFGGLFNHGNDSIERAMSL